MSNKEKTEIGTDKHAIIKMATIMESYCIFMKTETGEQNMDLA